MVLLKFSKDYKVFPIQIQEIIQEAQDTVTFIFNKPEGLQWDEGAHTHLALDNFDEALGWWKKEDVRHFSIMSLSNENKLALTTRLPKICTHFKDMMKKATIGDTYYLFKVGSRLKLKRDHRPVVALTAGVALATARPLIRHFIENPEGIERFISIHIDSSADYLFEQEIAEYALREPLFQHITVDRREQFYLTVEEMLATHTELMDADYYVVGSDSYLMEVRACLLEAGVEEDHIIFDRKDTFLEQQLALQKKA